MPDQEWYTLAELVDMFKSTMFRVRTTVGALRASGGITARDKPTDRRVVEVHKDSLPILRKTLLGE